MTPRSSTLLSAPRHACPPGLGDTSRGSRAPQGPASKPLPILLRRSRFRKSCITIEAMNRLILISVTAIISAALVAGCGGGGKKQQAPPSSGTNTGPGGTVTAEPTLGRLGGAETVLPGKITVTGKPSPT